MYVYEHTYIVQRFAICAVMRLLTTVSDNNTNFQKETQNNECVICWCYYAEKYATMLIKI